jgi:repressor of nif and glnA expression
MVCTQELWLLQSSVAVQVRLIITGQLADTVESLKVTVTLVSQLSVAVAVPVAPSTQSNTLSEGQVITGAVSSCTVTVVLQARGEHPEHVAVTVKVKEPQALFAITLTEETFEAPRIVAPLTDQLKLELVQLLTVAE